MPNKGLFSIERYEMGDPGSQEPFTIKEETIENLRPLRVVCIGAGFSGIYAAIRIPEKLRNVELTVYEKNDGVGGVWWMNKYPGVACDIVSHSYQYSFEPNPYWSEVYASGAEIQKYMQGVAEKYGATRFIKTSHEVTKCSWNEDEKKWHIAVKNLLTGETINDTANLLISARGLLNDISWPDIEGLRSFKGKMMHPTDWDVSHDFRNQRIAVIGNGSSAIQIVPKLQRIEGTHLTCFGRSPTWISSTFGDIALSKMGMDPKETIFTKEMQEKWARYPEEYLKFRKVLENEGNDVHEASIKGSSMQVGGQAFFREQMQQRLATRPDLFDSMIPNFAPSCRRLTPGPGYLEALCEPNVDCLGDEIAAITPTGIKLKDGKELKLDAIICATGFRTSNAPPFPVLGRGGKSLESRWSARPETYLSMAVDGFPNHLMMFGPNSAIGSGSLTMILESQGDYVVKCIRKLQKEDYASMEVRPERVADFQAYCGEYFKRTVYSDDCESWYKNRAPGRGSDEPAWVSGIWPGSTLQAVEAFRAPRWEDFVYESVDPSRNLLRWLGDGWTTTQKEGDTSFYINPETVSMPLKGKPEEKEEYKKRPWSH